MCSPQASELLRVELASSVFVVVALGSPIIITCIRITFITFIVVVGASVSAGATIALVVDLNGIVILVTAIVIVRLLILLR